MSLPSLNLDAFYQCAQTGNFTKAAKKLFITQSALSQRIKNLEDELSTTLFIRDRKGIRPTEVGLMLLRYCQQKDIVENEIRDQLKGKKSSGLSGIIRIGGYSSIMRSVILPALSILLIDNPNLKINFLSRELEELPIMFKNGEIDYLILDQEIVKEGFVTEILGSEKNVLISKKKGNVPNIYLDHDENDLTTFNFFKLNKLNFQNNKIEKRYFDDVYGIIDAAKLGIGKAIVPFHLVKDDKELMIHKDLKELINPVVLHFYRQNFYPQLHDVVVNTLKMKCRNLL